MRFYIPIHRLKLLMGGALRTSSAGVAAVGRAAKRVPWDSLSSAAQAFSAVVVASLAIWAFFFSSLPEILEKQLRTEVVSANEELIEVRRNKVRLEDQQESLVIANQGLEAEQTALANQVTKLNKDAALAAKEAEQIATSNRALTERQSELTRSLSSLEEERTELIQELGRLKIDRAAYAKATGVTVSAQIATMANYDLAMSVYLAKVCAQYGQHRRWLEKTRRFKQVEAEWNKLPFEQKYDEKNPIYKEYTALSESVYDKPDIWTQVPNEPILVPGNDQIFFGKHLATVIGTDDPEELHKYLIGWLFDQTVIGRGGKAMTGRAFIERIKGYEFLSQLLAEEHAALVSTLDEFLVENPSLQDVQLRVVFDEAPDSDEIIRAGKKSPPDIEQFQQTFQKYLAAHGISEAATAKGDG
ncbi:MAG: hypothetical protein E5Y30_29495, partial [Mesorhizobium sp.]